MKGFMSRSKEIIEALDAADPARLGSRLSNDVEWVDEVPASGSVRRGRKAFVGNDGDDVLQGTITPIIEEDNVVVAGGDVRVTKKDGRSFTVRSCEIYELENGKVKRKSSCGSWIKD